MAGEKLSAGRLVGKTLKGTYLFEEQVAQGGMAWIYKGQHLSLQKPVAIKVLFDEFTTNEAIATRFLNEAKIQFSLRHPHIVQVSDLIDEQGILGMVMEWIEGRDLRHWHSDNPQATLPQVWAFMSPVIHAVAYIHDQGLVHRDLKPANVMLQPVDGRLIPKVADFGIAKVGREGGSGLTRTGAHMGTLRYMSPEQISDTKSVDHRTDIYALGIILYELLTGRTPFDGEVQEIMFQHISQPPTPLEVFRPGLSTVVSSVVLHCLAKDRDDRFASCYELLESLESALSKAQGEPIDGAAAELALVHHSALTHSNVSLPSGSFDAALDDAMAHARTILPDEGTPAGTPWSSTPGAGSASSLGGQPGPGTGAGVKRWWPLLTGFAVVALIAGIGGGVWWSRTPVKKIGQAGPSNDQNSPRLRGDGRLSGAPGVASDAGVAASPRRRLPQPVRRPPVDARAQPPRAPRPARRLRRRKRRPFRRRIARPLRRVVRRVVPMPRPRPRRALLRLRVFSRPAGAIVWAGDRRLGPTPVTVQGREGQVVRLQIKKDKYETARVTWRFRKGAPRTRLWTLKLFSPDPFGGNGP